MHLPPPAHLHRLCRRAESDAWSASDSCSCSAWWFSLWALGGAGQRRLQRQLDAAAHKLACYQRQDLRPTGAELSFACSAAQHLCGAQRFHIRMQSSAGMCASGRSPPLRPPAHPSPAGAALAVFEYAEHAANCIEDHHRSAARRATDAALCGATASAPRIASARVRVSRAPEPSDILWQHTACTGSVALTRRAASAALTLLIMAAGAGVQYGLAVAGERERENRWVCLRLQALEPGTAQEGFLPVLGWSDRLVGADAVASSCAHRSCHPPTHTLLYRTVPPACRSCTATTPRWTAP